MGLSRSQWLALAGGSALIIGAFVPLAHDNGVAIRMLGSSASGRPAGAGPPSEGLRTTLAIMGTINVLYGAVVVLLSTWWSSARHLLLPAIVGLVAAVALASAASGHHGITLGAGALVSIAGHAMTLAAALDDRRSYQRATGAAPGQRATTPKDV